MTEAKRRSPAGASRAWWVLVGPLVITAGAFALHVSRSELTADDAAFVLSFTAVQVVGAVLLLRQPGNLIGRLMFAMGLLLSLQLLVEAYAASGAEDGRYPVGAVVLSWAFAHVYLFFIAFIALLFYIFPTGRVSPRWRHVVRIMLLGLAIAAFGLYLKPGPLDDERPADSGGIENPFALDAPDTFFAIVEAVGSFLMLGGVAASVVALVLRYRGSSGVARLQMKWFATGAALFGVSLFVNLGLRNFAELPGFVEVGVSLAFLFLPLSIGNAILRHRLYEIDVFINRALVYALLTACVAAAYVGLIVSLQLLLDPVTTDSDLTVAASTLGAAALFRPMRRGIQAFVDRRFYRSKYDAAQTLDEFGLRLRDEVELDLVQADILGVLHRTVQPAHVGLWLKDAGS